MLYAGEATSVSEADTFCYFCMISCLLAFWFKGCLFESVGQQPHSQNIHASHVSFFFKSATRTKHKLVCWPLKVTSPPPRPEIARSDQVPNMNSGSYYDFIQDPYWRHGWVKIQKFCNEKQAMINEPSQSYISLRITPENFQLPTIYRILCGSFGVTSSNNRSLYQIFNF